MALTVLLAAAALPSEALAAFGGQNGKIAFTRSHAAPSTTQQVHTVSPDGSGNVAITTTSPSRRPAWSPNGTRIAVARGNSLLTVDQNGAGQQTLLTWTDEVGAIDWSPDGGRLVVELRICDAQFECRFDLHTLNANGTALTDITPDGFDDRNPSWSPDGTRIAFDSTKGEGNYDIYTVAPDGADLVRLTTETSVDADPDWSPDAQKLAFESNRSFGRWDIWSMDGDGSDQFRVGPGGSDPEVDEDPAWSPDGDLIVFARNSSGFVEGCAYRALWTMGADGTDPTQVTDPGGTCADTDTSPDWQPLPGPYPRPKGATPVRVPLVPAYRQCTAPNRTHGPPLAFPSCNPPAQESDHLTVGTPETNAHPANSIGFLRLTAIPGDPTQFGNQADVRLDFSITDVRDTATGDSYASGKELRIVLGLRITDKWNGPALTENATVTDLEVPLSVICHAGAGDDGARCFASSSLRAAAGVVEGKRALWQLSQVKVYDGGADGDADTTADNTLFAVQGVLVP